MYGGESLCCVSFSGVFPPILYKNYARISPNGDNPFFELVTSRNKGPSPSSSSWDPGMLQNHFFCLSNSLAVCFREGRLLANRNSQHWRSRATKKHDMTCLVFFMINFIEWEISNFQDSKTHQNLWSKCCVLMVHGLFHSMSMVDTMNFHPVDSPCFLKELETKPQPRDFSPKQSYEHEMGRFDHQSYSIPKGTWILSE